MVIAAVIFRVASAVVVQHGGAGWLSNFAPLAAIALCGAIYFPRKYKFTLPFVALLVSDLALDFYYGASLADPLILCRYVAFALVGLLGLAISRRASLKTIVPASLAGSTIFYVITNFFSWLTDPGYVKNFAGLIQSLTVGLPQYGAPDLDVLPQLARERSVFHRSSSSPACIGARRLTAARSSLRARYRTSKCRDPSNATKSRCSRRCC